MPRKLRLSPNARRLYIALTGPLLTAPAANADTTAPAKGSDAAPAKSADGCRNDRKDFRQQMERDGYWGAGEGYSEGAAGFAMYGGRDTTRSVLDAAPQVRENAFTVGAGADSDSQRVDACWKANQPAETSP